MVLMLLHFLQCGVSPPVLPNLIALRHDLFDGGMELQYLTEFYEPQCCVTIREKNHAPIGDLLIGFLRYYAMFNYESDGIYIRKSCVAPK